MDVASEMKSLDPGGRSSCSSISTNSLEFLRYVFWTVATFWRWMSTQTPKWYSRLPEQDTIGLVDQGVLFFYSEVEHGEVGCGIKMIFQISKFLLPYFGTCLRAG